MEGIRLKSKDGLIAWEPCSRPNVYKAVLGRGSIMIEHNGQSEEYYPEMSPLYSLSFLNGLGEVFHSIRVYKCTVANKDFQLLKDIYEYAYMSHMKVEETLKSMLDDIKP